MSDTKRRLCSRVGTTSAPFRRTSVDLRRTPGEVVASAKDFDPATWFAVVEAQKLAIALAAGVDPSKVRIRIGH